jgi:multiple sugar transport system permease protein
MVAPEVAAGPAPARAAAVASGTGPSGGGWRRYRPLTFWLFVAPWALGFLLLTVVPMGFALWMSVTDYDGISPRTNFVGLGNFDRALHDQQMWMSLGQTVALMVVVVPLTVAFGLLLAALVHQPVRGRSIYRAIAYLPAVVPVVAGSLTFRLLFDHDSGAVNGALQAAGGPPLQWLAGHNALIVLISFVLWGAGASMVLSLAALQGVPKELTEAALVDGAGPWTRFVRISVPIISPILLFQVVTGVIAALQLFVPALLLSTGDNAGGMLPQIPAGLRVYLIYVYQQYFAVGNFGYASALLWLLFAVIVLITVAVFRLSRRMVFYDDADDAEPKGAR